MSSQGRARILAAVASALLSVAAAAVVMLRLSSPLPVPAVHVTAPGQLVLAHGQPPTIPVPSGGSFLLSSDTGAELAAAAADIAHPIGSVAKVMTALVVLQARPLDAGTEGPSVTLTSQDVGFYDDELAAGGSAVAVTAGETLTERQMLLALLLPSANNIAQTLAVWVSGTTAAFVARENSTAAALGMAASHFDDPSGLSSATVASARDLVRLAQAALGVPALADVVRTQTATLPDGTPLQNLDILLGTSGDWLGLKTGWTGVAGGCLLFAARHAYASTAQPLTIYGAVLGQGPNAAVDSQHPELGGAFAAARDSMAAAFAGYAAVDMSTITPPVSGRVSEPWDAAVSVTARPGRGMAVARLGEAVPLRVVADHPGPAPDAGARVATVRATASAGQRVTWPVETVAAVAGPSWLWHLVHG